MQHITSNQIDIIECAWNTYLKSVCEAAKLHEMEQDPKITTKISYLNIYITRLDTVLIKVEKMNLEKHIYVNLVNLCRTIKWNVDRINELLVN
jgi:hypothetical protein